MSGGRSIAGLVRRGPTVLRTLRHLRFAQAVAQLRHGLFGIAPPCTAPGPAPRLAIAAPSVPFLPPPAHVKSLGGGRFELLAIPFALPVGPDWSVARHGPLFAYHLHQHEYLRRADVPPAARAAALLDWIASHRAGIGWDPHPTGLRLLSWGKLVTTSGDLPPDDALRAALLRSFADQAETLSRNLEVRLQANHLLSNLLCVVFAGMLVESPASAGWRGRSPLLRRELARQIRPDGGHEERSPMYHAAMLEGVLDLLNLCRAAPERAPEGLEKALADAAGRMLEALLVLTHRDGRLALFSDSALDLVAEPDAIRCQAERLGVVGAADAGARGSACLPDSGYVRLVAGEWDLLASVAGPSPAHQPGHAHCDALAFELACAGRRVVSDTGVFEYVEGERRRRSRATASHATLQIDGEEQAEIWASHRVGGRPQVALVDFRAAGQGSASAEATCRGWSRPRTLHRRRFSVAADGIELEDAVEGPARSIVSRLPLAPGVEVELRTSAAASPVAVCRLGGEGADLVVEIALPSALDWRVEEGDAYPSFGRALSRSVLVGEGEGAAARGGSMRTRFRRIA